MASFIDRLRSLGSTIAEGASRAIASFAERYERNSTQIKSERAGWLKPGAGAGGSPHSDRHLTGERAFSQMMRGTGGIGWPGSWSQDRSRQTLFFRRWVHVACDRICSKIASLPPRVALVHPAGQHEDGRPITKTKKPKRSRTRAERQRLKHRRIHKRKLLEDRYKKSLNTIRPHEEVEDVGPNHPLVRLLAKPNAWDNSPGQIWYELVLFLLLTGNAYLWVVPAKLGGKPCELWVIPSQFVWGPKLGPAGPEYYEIIPYVGGIGSFRIPADEVIHFAFKNPLNKIDGFAPLQAGAEWVDVSESIDQSRYWVFKNGTQATGAIELGPKYDPDDIDIDSIIAKFMARYQGERNAGTPIVMPPDAKMVPLTIAPVDLAWEHGFESMRDSILALFAVPKEVAGIQDAGSEIAMYGPLKQFMEHAINPRLRYIGEVLTAALASRWDAHLRIWWDDATPPDPQQVNADINTDAQHGAITINQICAIRGREPFDDPLADEPLVNPNLIPLSMLKKKLEADAQKPPPGMMPGMPGAGHPPAALRPAAHEGNGKAADEDVPLPLAQRVRDNDEDNDSWLPARESRENEPWTKPNRPLPWQKKSASSNGLAALERQTLTATELTANQSRNLLTDFPDVRQETHYTCGAASSMACGLWYGVGPKNIKAWEKALGTTIERSTHPDAIADYLEELGLRVEARHEMTLEDLAGYTSRGWPVICPVQDWGTRIPDGADFAYGHYLTVLGVSDGGGMVFCQDSSIENAEHEPGGDVPKSQASSSGNIAAPGRVMIDARKWMEVWHDKDAEGNKFVQFGIAVGPPAGWREKSHPARRKCMEGPNRGKPGPCPQPKTEPLPTPEQPAAMRLDPQPESSDIADTSATRGQVRPTPEHYLSRSGPKPASAADRSPLHRSLETQRMKHAINLSSGANDSYILTLEDGTRGIFKPGSGESEESLRGVPKKTGFRREVAASRIAEILGYQDLVPVTTFREQAGNGIGSIQNYVDAAQEAFKVAKKDRYDGLEDAARTAAFDYLLGNLDRHQGNWLMKDGKLVLIDNGFSLPTNYHKDDLYHMEFWHQAVKHDLELPDMSGWKDKWPAIEKELRNCGIEDEAIALTRQRFENLVEATSPRFGDLPGFFPKWNMRAMVNKYDQRNQSGRSQESI